MRTPALIAASLSLLLGCTQSNKGGSGAGGTTGAGGATGGTTGTGGTTDTGGTTGTGGATGAGGAGGSSAGGAAGGTTGTGGSGGVAACTPPPTPPTPAAGAMDVVNGGTLVQFNDNGAWSWYQDERAIVDTAANKLIIGSDANSMGAGGGTRNGAVEVVIYDLTARTGTRYTLGTLNPDDHNAPAVLVRPDGRYLAFYAGHNQDCISYFTTFNGTSWSASGRFDWSMTPPMGCDPTASTKVTYSNLWNMSSEGKIYNFVRSVGTSPNVMISSDMGATWTYGGRLTSTPQVGYVAGYYKYWGNGVDRVDFIGTEAHPRDFDTSLYHGYVKGGKTYDSADTMVDASLSDATQPQITAFTKVFATQTMLKGVTLNHAWNIDVMRYADGTVAVLFKARADNMSICVPGMTTQACDPDHRMLYARFSGGTWKTTYLVKAGKKLYPDEQDYVGLGALHPNDPNTIYVSSTYDPRDDTTTTPFHELYQGTTCDGGATFTWIPVTQKSTRDNLRPIVPSWDASHTALLWWRGTYSTAQQYNAAVVGLITTKP